MPIYQYRCKCGHEFESLAKVSADAPECPQCKSTEVAKAITAPPTYYIKGNNECSTSRKGARYSK